MEEGGGWLRVCVYDWHHYSDAWKLRGEKGRHLYSLLISHLPN